MTSGNAEFQSEFNKIRLRIQIQVKIGEKKKKQTPFEGENLQNFTILEEKICVY